MTRRSAPQTASERFLARFRHQGRVTPATPRQLPLIELQADFFSGQNGVACCSRCDPCDRCEQAIVDAAFEKMDLIDAERAGAGRIGPAAAGAVLVTPPLCAMGGTPHPKPLDV